AGQYHRYHCGPGGSANESYATGDKPYAEGEVRWNKKTQVSRFAAASSCRKDLHWFVLTAACIKHWNDANQNRLALQSRRSHHRLGKAKARSGHVIGVDLDAQPAATQQLGGLAGDIAAGEWVQHQLTGLGQKTDEEIRQFDRKTRGVDGQAGRTA